jgi:hypothetical protein
MSGSTYYSFTKGNPRNKPLPPETCTKKGRAISDPAPKRLWSIPVKPAKISCLNSYHRTEALMNIYAKARGFLSGGSIGLLSQYVTRRIIIADDYYIATTLCFCATDLAGILPYHLCIVTRGVPVRGIEGCTMIH